jgi:hypothetical protein
MSDIMQALVIGGCLLFFYLVIYLSVAIALLSKDEDEK